MKSAIPLYISLLATTAWAQPLEFVVDPAQSSVDMTIELNLGALGGDTDSANSALSGTNDAELDDPSAPTESSLHDFQVLMDSDLNFQWNLGFLSTADATLESGFIEYAEPGTILGPVPLVSDAYEFIGVPTLVGGILTVDYDIFLFGSGTEIIDLSTFEPTSNDIVGTVLAGKGIVTMLTTIPFQGSEPLIIDGTEVGQAVYSGQATIVAIAQLPDCPPDLNSDGQLDFFDISAFLTAFTNQDPIADFNNDGVWDFFDISAFLTAFGAGCP